MCPHCRSVIILCEDLSAEEIAEIVELHKSDLMKAYEKLQAHIGCDILQAKVNFMHLRCGGSRFHNCDAEIAPGSLLCPQCMSVNLDW